VIEGRNGRTASRDDARIASVSSMTMIDRKACVGMPCARGLGANPCEISRAFRVVVRRRD
jgi:hypothetical protein